MKGDAQDNLATAHAVRVGLCPGLAYPVERERRRSASRACTRITQCREVDISAQQLDPVSHGEALGLGEAPIGESVAQCAVYGRSLRFGETAWVILRLATPMAEVFSKDGEIRGSQASEALVLEAEVEQPLVRHACGKSVGKDLP